MKMIFSLNGIESEKDYDVIENKNGVITLKTHESEKDCYKFDSNTGECLNDNTTFGASRRLKIKNK